MISFAEWKNSKKKEQNTGNSVSFAEWRNKKIASEVDTGYLDSFFTDADAFLKTSSERYNTIGWENASRLYDTTNKEWTDLRNRADKISAWAEYNKDRLSEEDYKSLTDSLSSIKSTGNSIHSGFHQNRNFYSQFDTEDAYKEWYEKDQIRQDFENVRDTDPMFDQYVQSGTGVVNPTWNKANGGWKLFGDTSEPVLNMVTFAEENAEAAFKDEAQALRGGGGQLKHTEAVALIYQHMKDEEKAVYNYYIGKGDKAKADEYLTYMLDILRQRAAGAIAEGIDDTAMEAVFSGLAGMKQWMSGVENLDNLIKGTESDRTSSMQYAHSMMSGNNKGAWKVTNDLINSAGNMLPSIVVGTATGGLGGALATGLSSAGNSYSEMIKEGYGADQARKYGIMVGTAEAGLSYLFSGISKVGGKVTGNAISKAVDGIDNGIARFFVDYAINTSSEALEEGAQAILDPVFKKIATGEDFEGIDWSEVGYSAMLGGLSAGLLEGVPNATKSIHTNYQTNIANGGLSNMGAIKAFKDNGIKGVADAYNAGKAKVTENAGYLVNEALEIDPDNAHAQRMQTRLNAGKNVSGYQIDRLVEANESAMYANDSAKIKDAVVNRLLELGEVWDVNSVADAIAKQAMGAELTAAEKRAIQNSSYGYRVATEVDPKNVGSGNLANKWAETIGTEKYNVEAYNRGIPVETETSSSANIPTKEAVAGKALTASVAPKEAPFTVKNTPVKENATEAKFEASKSGVNQPVAKAIMKDTEGNDVDVKVAKIADVENGEASLELEDGKTVKASDVDFGDSGVGIVYKAAAEMVSGVGGFNLDAANLMVRGFNPSGTAAQALAYTAGFNKAYREGALGYPLSALATGEATSKLTPKQREMAYNLGKAYGEGKVAEKQAKIVSILTKKDENISKKASQKGKVYFDGSTVGKSLTERQRASLKGLRVVAEGMGVNIHIFESKVVDGKRRGANGWYDPSDNSIHIDLHAGADGNALMLFTASHELTHHIREISPAKFKIFADALLEEYTKNGVSLDELIANKIEQLERNGRITEKMTEEQIHDLAYEEVVADSCEAMLVDSNAMEALSRKIHGKDKSLWETIKDFIAKLVTRIKAAYEGLDPDSAEGKKVREMTTSAERLQKLWVDALLDASEASRVLGENGIEINSDTESASLYSVRDLLDSNQQQKVSTALAERFGVTQAEAEGWLTAETSLASLILNPKYSQYLDYTGDPNEEAIKSNSDYPQGTVDFSNICKKRRDFTEVMNRVLRNFPNHVFAPTDLAKIRTIMEQEGMEVACAICYVEDRRQLDSVVAQDFIDSLAIYREGGKVRPDGKPFNSNQLKAFKLIEGDTYTPSIYELISLKGRNSLKEKNPAMEEAWVKFNNARGMQSVRLLLNDAEYKRQILKYSPSVVERKNDHGGLRIYSFSDMEMFHLIDIIQVITDSATVGLSIQGYTKVNEYAKAVKDTGEKLNRSLIPKGDLGYHMEGGRVVLDFDTVEGIDINHPDFFDNIDNPNIGNIVIGINATQIKAAMASKFIDQIIPFHTGQSGEVLGEKGIAAWENYKDYQSERDVKTQKKSSHQINIYTEVINAAEAEGKPIKNKVDFVNKFLEVCKENNLIPRFSEFLNVDENGNYVYTEGYHKFLVDFKTFDQNTGEYLPQMPVKPIFDNEYITQLLTDYVKSQKAKDAELAKTMPKVLDRITNEIVKPEGAKYSDRIVDLSDDNDLSALVNGIHGAKRYKTIAEYIRNAIEGDAIVFADGLEAIVDNRDASHIAHGAGKHKVNQIAKIKDLISQAVRFAEENDVDHNKFNQFLYYESIVKYDDEVFPLYLNVGRGINDGKYHLYDITKKIRDTANRINGLERPKPNEGYAQENDISKDIIAQDTEIVNRKFSDRDSLGNELSKEQQEFFKDSKVRDKKGNLMVLYHGTTANFNTFKKGDVGFHFGTKGAARGRVGFGKNVILKEVYLNITNPIVFNEDLGSWDADFRLTRELYDRGILTQADAESVLFTDDRQYRRTTEAANKKLASVLLEKGYDGIAYSNTFETKNPTISYIIFSSNQAKETTNKAPTDSPDIRYQDRNPDSYSNRSLLAGALETAAQNDIERNKLKLYKEKIALINSEEQKLHDLRAQIKELSFAKGPRDAEAIRKLQFEANQAANRINTYDKQLLNLESTKALKGVLEREKAQARKRDAQKYKEAIDRYREKSAQTQRELMDRYQESRRRGTESRNKTAMRHKIKDVVNELNQYLLKGTKDKHVPIELQKAVAEALDAVNMDTVGAEERIAKLKAEMMRAKTPEAVQEIAKTIEHIEEMGGNMEAKLSRLKTAYDGIINSEDPLIANSHDEVISNTIQHVMEYVGETPLRDMSLSQLEAVYDMYRMVLHTIRGANKAFKAKKSEEISVIANRVMEEVDKLGKKKKLQTKAGEAATTFDWNNQKPIYAFERIGSNTFTEVFNNVRTGEDTWAVNMEEAKAFLENQKDKHNYDSWDLDKKYDFISTTGKNFSLSIGQIMSLYAYSKRGTQAKDHLRNGGFVFDGLTEVKEKGKLGVTKTYQLKDSTAYNLSDEILSNIISKLTEEQKAFADVMQAYLSDTMGDKGNEVSLELYGVKLFKEKNYFPLKSAPQFLERAREQAQGEVKIKNKGFTKETTPQARNPIVLTSFMDVWAGHVNEMSMYHAFTLALEDFYRVYNYKTPASETLDSESVISFLENAHGNASASYIDQLLKDLNGGARSDPRETVAKSMMSKFKKASVIASASVVIQQPSSIVRAQALVDAKYFVGKKVSEGKHKETWAEVKKYAPVAVIKEMGYFDVGMGQSSTEWLKGEKTWRDKVDDVLSKAPALADEYTWVAIWNAVKRETAHNNPTLKTNSEDFLKLAGERFTEVITKTQVYDSTLARSANMRSKSGLMNMWTSFLAEPTTSINMLQDAFKKGDKKYIARTMGAVYGSVVLNAALVSLVYAMRDDDEDETFLEKYMSRFVTEVIDGINPLTYIPFVKDIWSALQGYDIERSDMTLITTFIGSLQQLVKVAAKDTSNMSEDELTAHRKAVAEAVLGITDNLASLTGLPVKNIRREINGVINGVKTIVEDANGRKTTAGSLGDNILEDVKDSTPVWGWFPDESKGDKLYDAIIKGDDDYVERLESGYKSETAIDSAIRKALRENDPRIKEAAEALSDGDFSEYEDILNEIVDEGNFDFKNVKAAILKEYEDMTPDEETITEDKVEKEESAFETEWLYMAISEGDVSFAKYMRESIINTHIANGKSREEAEASFNSSFTSSVKRRYEDGDISDSEAKSMLVNFGGKTKEEAESKVQYWSFKKQYPDYDLTESAVSKYYSDVKPSGISVAVYYDYTQKRSKAQGVDLNGDGKTDSGTVKREVMQIINSLPISSYQKDVLYYLNGWSQSTLWEAPWH